MRSKAITFSSNCVMEKAGNTVMKSYQQLRGGTGAELSIYLSLYFRKKKYIVSSYAPSSSARSQRSNRYINPGNIFKRFIYSSAQFEIVKAIVCFNKDIEISKGNCFMLVCWC